MNPDYKPAAAAVAAVAAAVVAAPEAPPKPIVPGVTTFFGASPAPAEKPAVLNPDYTPAVPPVVAAAPPPPAPAKPAAPGVTSFFGASPTPAEKPAVMNPDYKPTANAVAAAPVPAAAPLTASFQACQDNINSAVKSGGIRFNSAKSTLTDTSIVTLTQIAAAITACPGSKLSIEGHTDDTGDDSMNQTLSDDRARAVVEYLVGQGIDAKRLTSKGYGETRPVAPNDSATNKARNRRIDFVLSAS
jgi:peptidoglycan-binding protein ArfA